MRDDGFVSAGVRLSVFFVLTSARRRRLQSRAEGVLALATYGDKTHIQKCCKDRRVVVQAVATERVGTVAVRGQSLDRDFSSVGSGDGAAAVAAASGEGGEQA